MKTSLCITALSALVAIGTGHSAQAVSVAVLNGSHDVVNGTLAGHLGLSGLGHTSTLYSDDASGWASALASGADAIVIEQAGDDGMTTANVMSYIAAGGRVVMLGGSGSASYNALFGVAEVFAFEGADLEPFAKTAAAAGTTFADDAATLLGLSSHHELTSGVPVGTTVFYGGAGNEIVFRQTHGAGDFFYLGWDYCCGGTVSAANDWYGVLDSALTYAGSAPAVPLPAGLPLALGGFGLLGVAGYRRKRT